MFEKMLPDSVKDDVKKLAKQNNCEFDLDKQIAYVYSEMGTVLDEKLSRWNLNKLQQQLKLKPKNTTGINALSASEPSDATIPPPPTVDMAALNANMERMINAAFARQNNPPGQRGRGDDRTGSAS